MENRYYNGVLVKIEIDGERAKEGVIGRGWDVVFVVVSLSSWVKLTRVGTLVPVRTGAREDSKVSGAKEDGDSGICGKGGRIMIVGDHADRLRCGFV